MIASSLLTTFLLALTVAAKPVIVKRSPVTLPLARRFNLASAHNLLRHDQARAQALKKRSSSEGNAARDVINSAVENHAIHYVASVGVGNPAKTYSLVVDTGSANTWIGANQAYVKTSTSVQTSDNVTVPEYFSGIEYLDQVAITDSLVISQQSIGVAMTVSKSPGDGVDGVLGIGPVDLTLGTLSPDTVATIPTVTDNLFTNGAITDNEISISFEPITDASGVQMNGELTWGGTDSTKFTGSINYVPITTASPANTFWGIDQSVSYGTSTILPMTAGIVDTGTTLIKLATEAFNQYQSATGGVLDSATSLLRITSSQYSNLKSLFFNIGGVAYELTPNAQIWPRNLNTLIGGTAGDIYLIVSDIGSPSGQGLDFINGLVFLERFYSVFDTANHRVGFATTPYTTATTN